jgi:hypothetical protein
VKLSKVAVTDAQRKRKIKSRTFFCTLRKTGRMIGRRLWRSTTLRETAERSGKKFWPEYGKNHGHSTPLNKYFKKCHVSFLVTEISTILTL